MANLTYEQIIDELKNRIYRPIYLLMGEEPYFIDSIADYIENNILNDIEKSFNLTIIYGKDTDLSNLVLLARRYPMMANYQVIIVREAQHIKNIDASEINKNINPLINYIEEPLLSTILVLCYNDKKIEKNKKLYKTIDKKGIIFESKKIYESKLPVWIAAKVKEKGKTIEPRAAMLMADFLGNNLFAITNEINKLIIYLENQKVITEEHVVQLIGVSKEFNNFELLKAIGAKNITQVNRILLYFKNNPRENPVQKTMVLLFDYFSKILLLKDFQKTSDNELASILGVGVYYLNDYKVAAQNYTRSQIIENIHLIREYDMKSKGVNSVADGHQLLIEMISKLMYGLQ